MNSNLEKTKFDFKKFREQCIWLQQVYNIYHQLNPDRYKCDNCINVSEIYKKTAPIFFDVIFIVMHEHLYLQVARITDPAEQIGNTNLSIPHINFLLTSLKRDTNEIKSLSEKILLFAKPIKNARNKIIAHADKNTIINEEVLGGHPNEQAWPDFFENLHRYIDVVSSVLEVGSSDFSNIGNAPGDSSDLIRYLRAGLSFHGNQGPFGIQSEDFYRWVEEKNIADELLRQYIRRSKI